MSKLLTRVLTGFIYGVVVIFSILYSEYSYIGLISVFGVLCIWEFSKLIDFKSFVSYLFFGLIIFLMFKRPENYALKVVLGITILSSIYLIYQLFSKTEITYTNDRSKLGTTIRYVVFSMCFLVLIPFYNQEYHPYIILSILILIWVNDSFAFFVGKNIGRTKLFESVSPKKTIEGFIGGMIFSLIAGYIISMYLTDFSIINWLIIAAGVSILGTIGDLIESKFKRQANVKDSGTILPGHGGMLDRLDSLLFVSPFVYLYIHFII
ncbi:phosphatidate cytidylyltransferase [Lutibacter sp. Hel_I_33_5]|uniref:phosphatidate cytidylyltransferase n=1 Tax=Lutibacter sp. Hel_I_33_5 TaxID=1566289 RepID=UPI0011A42D6D|nr:phosphatidate cytidylyltransferase [Lutibacter sp. Hel_I_33_5]TVZ57095.1 phosphatidate cytidylyltransferase [Lutibacter sp. Hel_I_33_5]